MSNKFRNVKIKRLMRVLTKNNIPVQGLFFSILLLCMSCIAPQKLYALDVSQQDQPSQQINVSDQQLDELKLKSEQWDQARHGEQLIRVPVLKSVVNEWSSKKGSVIELRYPGGEEGELWVRELMDWLISLGIPSQYLVSVPGSGEADVIKFQIIKTGESYR